MKGEDACDACDASDIAQGKATRWPVDPPRCLPRLETTANNTERGNLHFDGVNDTQVEIGWEVISEELIVGKMWVREDSDVQKCDFLARLNPAKPFWAPHLSFNI